MENKNSTIALIVLGIISLVLVGALYHASTQVNGYSNQDRNTLSVTGTSTIDAMPDQAEIYLRLETINADPKLAQAQLTSLNNHVLGELKANGLDTKEIETTNYYLEKYQTWEGDKYVDKGYRASHTLKLTVKDISRAGEYLNL